MIWFFGDSYSTPPEKDSNLWQFKINWMSQLASNLNTDAKYVSSCGVANEWILHNFIENQINFKENDYVIVQTTTSHRRWFFEDRPHLGNFYGSNIVKNISKEENNSIKKYLEFLYHEKQDKIFYKSTIYSLLYLAEKMPNVKILILPGAHGCPGVIGDLTNDVCDKEFSSIDSRNKFYKKHNHDPRPNHISEKNHEILAAKITEYFNYHKPLDLTTGFQYNIYI